MSTMTQDLLAQLDGAPLQQISRQLGIDQDQAAGAVGAALPLLMGALGKNASQPQGAEALFGALQKDHAGGGGIGDLLGAVLGGAQSRQTDGAGVLGHIFGGQQARAEQSLGAATGLGGDRAGQLMKILAPIVMAYLAKRMFSGNDGGSGQSMGLGGGGNPTADILGAVLGQEQQQVRQQGGIGGGLLGAVLDKDGDGDVDLSDVLKLGGGLFGGNR
ncbi:MAG: DUF937 domain-containing protein [Xanthomonadaceae bacterium]|nr:DUF937 domain-containing protein [Xanthomonadaceae bacterium]